jgi:hypothetical protein
MSAGVSRLLAWVIGLGMAVVAGVGFAASYDTLRKAAFNKGFSEDLSYWVPIGIDGAILAFLALDLYLTARRIPWPVLRFAAHGMTLATVLLNATGGGRPLTEDPVRALWHGLMPLLFVVGVEAVRRLILRAAQLEDGTVTDRIPLHRWLLAPGQTARLYRRMRLAGVRSYPEMIRREQDLDGYRVWLTQELGGDLSQASEVQRLPMTLAPKGFTVEEALALPARWEAEAAQRARAEEERRALAEAEAAEREAELEIKKAAAAGRVETARHRLAAETGTAAAEAEAVTAKAQARAEVARAEAEHARTLAERRTQFETQALESAEAAAARRRAAEDARKAAQAEAEAEVERRRAQAERLAAEAELAEAERRAQIEAEALETEAAAAARRRAAEQEQAAAEAERRAAADQAEAERLAAEAARQRAEAAQAAQAEAQAQAVAEWERARAAEARRHLAVAEAEAQTAEDYARLSQRERRARRVARMILTAGGGAHAVDVVTLADIEADLGVSRTTAGELRQEAAELLAGGYDPATDYQPQC